MKSMLTVLLALTCCFVAQPTRAADATGPAPQVVRLPNNPIIRPEMLPSEDGKNINGPTLIRVPSWIEKPLGKYYLYFGHHHGQYIRLAYADKLEGPWKIHEPGTLSLKDSPGCVDHISSPDAIVDEESKEIRLYFHGPAKAGGGQKTFLAVSKDGLKFSASAEVLGIFYWRVFRHDGWWYGMAKGGLLYRSRDGRTKFEQGPNPFPGSETRGAEYNTPGVRHVAIHSAADAIWIYYTNIGDAPERIFRCHMPLAGDWKTWKPGEPQEILKPETEWEGGKLPLKKSKAGAVTGAENALRDPAIFVEDGRVYLLYSIAGEMGIAIAECKSPSNK